MHNYPCIQVRFKYDPEIFSEDATFDTKVIKSRLRELAFLNSSASIHYMVEEEAGDSPPEWATFHFEGGLKEYVQYLNRDKKALHDVVAFQGEKGGVKVRLS